MMRKNMSEEEIAKVIGQIKYVNQRLKEMGRKASEEEMCKICKECGTTYSTFRGLVSFVGFKKDRKLNQYVEKQIEGQIDIENIKVVEEPQEPTQEVKPVKEVNTPLQNEHLKKADDEVENVQVENQFNNSEVEILKQMINDYTTKQNTKCSIKINDTTTTVTSLRLNKELYSMVKDRAATEKIGITEIFNKIMLDYLNK